MQNKMFYVILIVATLFIDTLGQFGGFKPMTKYKNDLNESNIGSNLIDYKFVSFFLKYFNSLFYLINKYFKENISQIFITLNDLLKVIFTSNLYC